LALAQLPSVFQAARDPVGAAAALLRLAGEHPQVTSGGAFHGNMDMWNNENVSTIPNSWNHPGAASFLDALAKFKRSLVDLSKVGTDLSSTAEATARVLSDATREKTKNTASAFCELLTQNETTQHLWRSVLFLAIPLLEGTRSALSKVRPVGAFPNPTHTVFTYKTLTTLFYQTQGANARRAGAVGTGERV